MAGLLGILVRGLVFVLVAVLCFDVATASASPVWIGEGELDGAAMNQSEFPPLTGMSCPTIALWVAVDSAGDIVTSTDPIGGAGAWTTRVLTATHGQRAGLISVSCSPSGTCAATEENGDILASNDPTGGAAAWTVASVESAAEPPSGVSCRLAGYAWP